MSTHKTIWRKMWQTWLSMGWIALLLGLIVSIWSIRYTLEINTTPSLPHKLFVVEKGSWPQHVGELLAYRSSGHGPLPAGITVVKRVVGMPGDTVSKHTPTLDGNLATPASAASLPGVPMHSVIRIEHKGQTTEQVVKPFSRSFVPLQSGPTGVIPDFHYHVGGDHPDSFDSRYALMGWIRADQVIGKVVWAW